MDRVVRTFHAGAESGEGRGLACGGLAGVELLTKRGRGRQQDTTELAERGCLGFHITISGDVELTDGLDGLGCAGGAG